ncbi:MAG TPA: hypothetical protein VK149_06760 [Sideroxyarcus sp.]|nr:hypothetical protein [Sideroxyarcus sp.]
MPTSPELRDFQQRGTQEAIECAESCGLDFDLSPASVAALEEMLAVLHEGITENPSIEGMEGCATFYGAYLASVFEKAYGAGTWERDHPEIGDYTFPFYIRGHTLFPIEWCRKRIFHGAADNVLFKFQVLQAEIERQDG